MMCSMSGEAFLQIGIETELGGEHDSRKIPGIGRL